MSGKQADWHLTLRGAAERRLLAVRELDASLASMNAAVRDARAAGMSAVAIAEAIETTRQRVYEILREG